MAAPNATLVALLEPGLAAAVATVIAAAGQVTKVIAAVKVIFRVSLRMAPTVLSRGLPDPHLILTGSARAKPRQALPAGADESGCPLIASGV
ncbi:hypothetical protein BZL29_5362 [Mycobacterium kansasii]|uniref:Uncharacterized protein n=1 Tax=Mycobacterium kansasii TaxID=1768 RepID=A0A1V3X176_MYCKA|nr:hypothetical protein BZL29_5362 [Mycobacterium kansasii]